MTLAFALLFGFGGAGADAATPIGSATAELVYPTVVIPKGKMDLELPQNQFLTTDFLKVPVVIDHDFRIGKYEVTNHLWGACVDDGACEEPAQPRPSSGPYHPVIQVNWHDAHQFSKWLSGVTGHHYRLPTDHEWFYASSMGEGFRADGRTYDYSELEEIRKTPKRAWPVGQFGENDWGMADNLGNVWEWTLSCRALAPKTLLAKQDPKVLNDPAYCITRIVGGEHRAHVPDFIRDTYSGGCATLRPASNLGFRLVRED
jgi:formylglycine-generating enzyme required for sulfatase activity